MRWIFLILIFASGIYYLFIHQAKKEKIQEQIQEDLLSNELVYDNLPEKIKIAYTLKLTSETKATLRAMTLDVDEKVRWAAIELLYRIDDEFAIQIIKEAFVREIDVNLKKKIVGMLGQVKDRQSLMLLETALNDYEKDVKIAALDALGNFETPEVLPVINKAMQDYESEVKLKAIEALNKIQKALIAKKENQLRRLKDKLFFNKQAPNPL